MSMGIGVEEACLAKCNGNSQVLLHHLYNYYLIIMYLLLLPDKSQPILANIPSIFIRILNNPNTSIS